MVSTEEKADGLRLWFHPSMHIPFPIKNCVLPWSPDLRIAALIEQTEGLFNSEAAEAAAGVELQINVLWDVNNHSQALDPAETVGQHFKQGDTCAVYGDVMPLSSR